MYNKIWDTYDSYDDSDKLQNRFIAEMIKDDSPFMRINKLLILSMLYKRMKLAFLVYLLEAELSKPNGEISKHEIELISCKLSTEEDSKNCRVKGLDLEFKLTLSEGDFEVNQTETLQDKLKSLGFSGIKVDIQDKIIHSLCLEYLEFLLFPLIIYQINEENKRKKDKN